MQRVMLYCQYLSGMGHLVRTTQFAEALSERFDVTLVIGGPKIGGFVAPPNVRVIYLPPLWLENGAFRVADGAQVDRVKAKRRQTLIGIFDDLRPDAVITEFFPFGRHDLMFELKPWIEHIRATAPRTLIVSSLRDLIGKTILDRQIDTIAALANRFFDATIVHADPRFLRFETCFPEAHRIECPILHTGFVAQACEEAKLQTERPFVLVSVGGGRIGGEVLAAAVGAAAILETDLAHDFRIFTGPFLPDDAYTALTARAAGLSNVHIERFTARLMPYMQAADLSVSLAGYNTTMNVLRARVPAILIPIGHYDFDCEQVMRAERLADLGTVDMLPPAELSAETLAARIRSGLQRGPSETSFNLDGARTATDALADLFAKRACGNPQLAGA